MAKKPNNDMFVVNTAPKDAAPTIPSPDMTIPRELGQSVINLIDGLSTRGAFKGDELLFVGALRQRLVEGVTA